MSEEMLIKLLNSDCVIDNLILAEILDYIFDMKKQSKKKQVDYLALLIKFIDMNNIDLFIDKFLDIYYKYPNKIYFFPLIVALSNKIKIIKSQNQYVEFLDKFTSEFPFFGLQVTSCYLKTDPEKALRTINKIDCSYMLLNDKKKYFNLKKDIYMALNSNKMVIKCLVELFILGEFNTYEQIKEMSNSNEFKNLYSKMIYDLVINDDSDIHTLHTIFIKEYDIDNLIKHYKYYSNEIIYEDIAFFKVINVEYAKRIYEYYLINIVLENEFDIDLVAKHLYDLYIEYNYRNFDELLTKINQKVNPRNYQKIVKSISLIVEERK